MAAALDLTGLVLPTTVEERNRSDDNRSAEYVLQPLERGFGRTIGNSIRRVLLSSLPGSAVWAFRADGVQHEHQAIPGVVEDVHQIIQNLKGLVPVLDADVDEAKLELAVSKAGVVRASRLESHAAVRIVNPEQLLFTLQEDLPKSRPLRMDLWVNKGRGFVMAESHELPEDAPVDLIRVDSIYNPVLRANFIVDETRVGQRTDFDSLTLQVETDGSVDPVDAIEYAARITHCHLGYLTQFSRAENGSADDGTLESRGAGEPVSADMRSFLERSLDSFEEISVRSCNTLDKADIHTIGDAASRTRDEMLNVANFGEKSLEEIAAVLAMNGLHFGMKVERDEGGNVYVTEGGSGGNGTSGETGVGEGS